MTKCLKKTHVILDNNTKLERVLEKLAQDHIQPERQQFVIEVHSLYYAEDDKDHTEDPQQTIEKVHLTF